MTAFTPGPWRVGNAPETACYVFAEHAGQWTRLAHTLLERPECDLATAVANARLMASAPRLLDAIAAWQAFSSHLSECERCEMGHSECHRRDVLWETAQRLSREPV